MVKLLVLLSAGALVATGCASQPAPSLLDRKFEQEARQYQKYQHEGQTVYCRKEKVITSAVPVTQCLKESDLRLQVENYQMRRNAVQPAVMPGTGQGGIGR